MGVKDLWTILSPVCEKKSLWELRDKTVAIDLSCWICDSQNISDYKTLPRMYLRNLFFRTNCLLLLGAHPVFVLEGKAPELKYKTMDKRINTRKKGVPESQVEASQGGNRSRLNGLSKKCQQLLSIMGLTCVRSPGEAEAFCALLNNFGLVDGCITQDGDCFLYGANTVYRNFTISPSGNSSGSNSGFSIDVYKMPIIEERLCLGRNELIAISLLCGCDYNEKGVSGVGKETVLKFLKGIKGEDVLMRLQRWRTDPYFEDLEEKRSMVTRGVLCEICGHSGRKSKHLRSGCGVCGKLEGCKTNTNFIVSNPSVVAELNIRKRALLDSEFPSQMMIDEYLHQEVPRTDITLDKNWNKPDMRTFIVFAVKMLGWTEMYAIEKFLPLVTRWQILELQNDCHNDANLDLFFHPELITKKRVLRGIDSYEIKWKDSKGIVMEIDPSFPLITVEPKCLVEKAYPLIVEAYIMAKNMKNKKVTSKKKINCPKKDAKKGKENLNANVSRTQKKIERYLSSPIFAYKKRVLQDHTNAISIENKSNKKEYLESDERGLASLKLNEGDNVRRLSNYFSKIKLSSEKQMLGGRNGVVDITEDSCKISSSKHNHQMGKVRQDLNSFEKSLSWDNCEICDENDQINDEDLSLIIDSIVNKKAADNNVNVKSNDQLVEVKFTSFNENLDEFDDLECKFVPLIDRIRSQL